MGYFQKSFAVLVLIVIFEIHSSTPATLFFKTNSEIGFGLPTLPTLFPRTTTIPYYTTRPPRRPFSTTTTPIPVEEDYEDMTFTIGPNNEPKLMTDFVPEKVTIPTVVTPSSVDDGSTNKILEKLEEMDKKFDQLQEDLKKAQETATKQNSAIERVRRELEEYFSNLSAQMEDGFLHINIPTVEPTTTTRPTESTTTEEPLDVDIRSRSFPSKFPIPGIGSKNSSSPFPSPPSVPSLSSLSQKLPPIPVLNPEKEDPTKTVEEPPQSPADENSALLKAINEYIPDVGLISDDPNLVRFLLYSNPKNPAEYEILEFENVSSITSSKFDGTKPVKFLVHGFQQNFNSSYPQNVKNAFLSKWGEDYNVVIVDWGLLSIPNAPYIAPVFYPFAVKNVWRTGIRLGEFISWLQNESLINLDKVHIIGFSLGSHVSGKAASTVQEKVNASIHRVTALDPAGPEFYTGLLARKLTPEDAKYVDAIHTNSGQLGIWQNVGHVDFYINGGSGPQPGCLGLDSFNAVLRSVTGSVTGTCSHNMATEFFAKTILVGDVRSDSDKLCGCTSLTKYKLGLCDCEEMVLFGEHSSHRTNGTFYMDYKL